MQADFVIVGGGSAGCVLANRLSEGGRYSVVLIEAGPGRRPLMARVPLGVGRLWNDPRYGWDFRSAPEPGLGGRRLALPRGRLLGGSGAVNAMNFVRGAAADFDAWHALGLQGWSAQDMAEAFRAVERVEPALAGEARGRSGPMGVTETPVQDALIDDWIAALEAQGHPHLPDYNAALGPGIGRAQFNIAHGRRSDPRAAYLDPVLDRRNLTVLSDHLVDSLSISEGRARHVVARHKGGVRRIAARCEIILAAGAFGSPHLLQVSGIGPGAVLQAAGIPPIVPMEAVGRNLWDHPRVALEYRRTPSYMHRLLRWDRLALRFAQALLLRSGPATWPLAAAHLFLRSAPDRRAPDFQVLLRLFDPSLQPWLMRAPATDRWGMVVCLVQPESRGHVRALSSDIRRAPEILTGILSQGSDMARMVATCQGLRRTMSGPGLAGWTTDELAPGPGIQTPEQWAQFVRASGDTIFHPGGTCAMGAVVDQDLSVHGVRGLRVVDASVMPLPISGNIHAAVLAVAEKGAALIRAAAG